MNTTITSGEPPYAATVDAENNHEATIPYGLGFFFVVIFLVVTLCYGSYIYRSGTRSRPPTPPFRTTNAFSHHADDDHRMIRISHGLDEDVLKTFPTFVYSEAMMSHNGDTNNSSCSICLGEYKPTDELRLLPECGHLFHVSCVDTWLKVHPTCPVCRNSPLVEG